MIFLTFVTLIAIFLVEKIRDIVDMGVPENFFGLILVPLVEKAAEHLTTVDEVYENQMVSTKHFLFDPIKGSSPKPMHDSRAVKAVCERPSSICFTFCADGSDMES